MNQAFTSSLATILSAPWHQRRNRKGMLGFALIVALCLLPPVVVFMWSVFADPLMAPDLRRSAVVAGRGAIAALSTAWWVVLVHNVLEQNHPTLAQVVPEHPRRLRAALLVTWALLVVALVGVVFGGVGDALAGVAVSAPAFALLAASVRWPALWFGGVVASLAAGYALQAHAMPEFERTALAAWHAQPMAIAAALVMASGLLLVAVIQSGGARHAAAYERRRDRLLRMEAASRGERVRGPGARSVVETLLARPYHHWMRHLLARPASSPRARALLAFGPGAHWTGNVAALVATAAAIAAAVVLALLVAQLFPHVREFLPLSLASTAIGTVFGLLGPAMQVQSRLHQTQREQALVALLPGVPPGVATSRWLSMQMTAQFLLSWAGAVVLMLTFNALASALLPHPFELTYASGCVYLVICTLPLVAFQWRRWARLPTPTPMSATGPVLLAMGLAAVAFAGALAHVATPVQSGIAFTLGTVAWCAWRWRRMAAEPSALPVGRLV
jgi:hypothetical protein